MKRDFKSYKDVVFRDLIDADKFPSLYGKRYIGIREDKYRSTYTYFRLDRITSREGIQKLCKDFFDLHNSQQLANSKWRSLAESLHVRNVNIVGVFTNPWNSNTYEGVVSPGMIKSSECYSVAYNKSDNLETIKDQDWVSAFSKVERERRLTALRLQYIKNLLNIAGQMSLPALADAGYVPINKYVDVIINREIRAIYNVESIPYPLGDYKYAWSLTTMTAVDDILKIEVNY
jgi:hypothetical protein